MQPAPIPDNETERLRAVQALGLLDTPPEERFDALTREALAAFHVPISTITLVDKDREWFKSCQGLDAKEGPRAISFCGHAMLASDVFIVEDTLKDERFKDNPMVVGKPFIRFYAAVSLLDKDGYHVGVFCIKDTKPRTFTIEEIGLLLSFGKRAEEELQRSAAVS